MNFKNCLTELSIKRPVFHSEADFQHEFALQIREHNPNCGIRLEYPIVLDKRIYLDMLLLHPDRRIGVELKYITRLFNCAVDSEEFMLKDHSADDLRRYDFFKDVERLEALVKKNDLQRAYAIFLTNNPNFWRESTRDTADKAFRMHENRVIQPGSLLSWGASASAGTTKGREAEFNIQGQHKFEWNNYSEIPNHSKNNIFRYLVLEIS